LVWKNVKATKFLNARNVKTRDVENPEIVEAKIYQNAK
jgi:hypothetical protein